MIQLHIEIHAQSMVAHTLYILNGFDSLVQNQFKQQSQKVLMQSQYGIKGFKINNVDLTLLSEAFMRVLVQIKD